ncbi:MAG: 4'-phosphopantetheinyl transferase superfamily protein [Psychrobacter sp.]|uniref:4'-phosphopantetheinyl transferase family protein n=1 Tax=Psychrobacter sp. TaxID=56811 RepID=UPI00264A1C83|nr:4'-phosphopantetheinyl transferase superfamily protein [Psychrobacter sp.]MDN5621178.1 4'-phosphopantetheinyl transferase superfamily protein [Psychrobacter sp.]
MMIAALNLSNIQYTQLNHDTWCATAKVGGASSFSGFPSLQYKSYWFSAHSSYMASINLNEFRWHYHTLTTPTSKRTISHRQYQQQRQGVRCLLQQLLDTLGMNDVLDESNFPYRLIDSGYYVCFSHTSIHDKNKAEKQSSRPNEHPSFSSIAVVISRHRSAGIDIESNNVAWHIAKRFYAAQEMAILQTLPTKQRDHAAKLLWQIKESFIKIHQYTLAQGLRIDYSDIVPALIGSMNKEILTVNHINEQSHYQIAVLRPHQTVVVF